MSVEFNIEIADRVVRITACYESTYDFCKDYLTDSPCDFTVAVTEKDIQYEHEKYVQEAKIAGVRASVYPKFYLETLALYRKIASGLTDYDTLLFHGSVIAVDSEAYLFAAKSGMGKSTHTKLWREHFGNRAVMINDDKPLLRITDNKVFAYGTPWDGKHRISSNISAPLKAIAILERDTTNHISKISKRTAFPVLYQQSFRPKEADKLAKVMTLIDKLGNNVALYQLSCNMQPDAVAVSYNGMNGRNI